MLLDSFLVRYALGPSQNFCRQVTLLSRELLKTAKNCKGQTQPNCTSDVPEIAKTFRLLRYKRLCINRLAGLSARLRRSKLRLYKGIAGRNVALQRLALLARRFSNCTLLQTRARARRATPLALCAPPDARGRSRFHLRDKDGKPPLPRTGCHLPPTETAGHSSAIVRGQTSAPTPVRLAVFLVVEWIAAAFLQDSPAENPGSRCAEV